MKAPSFIALRYKNKIRWPGSKTIKICAANDGSPGLYGDPDPEAGCLERTSAVFGAALTRVAAVKISRDVPGSA
jgi:hypothetical protein